MMKIMRAYFCRRSIVLSIAIGCCFLLLEDLSGKEIPALRPTQIVASSPFYENYEPEHAIDSDSDNYVCLLDDTPGGRGENTIPPRGDDPATAYVVFDLGETTLLCGIKIVAPKQNRFLPRDIDLYLLDCVEGVTKEMPWDELAKLLDERKAKKVVANELFSYFNNGQSRIASFEPARGRYVVMRSNAGHECGDMNYYINQFGEIYFFGLKGEDAVSISPDDSLEGVSLEDRNGDRTFLANRNERPYPDARLKLDWMRQDCGQLDVSDCFSSASANELERKMIRKVLDELAESGLADPFEQRLKTLIDSGKSGNDSQWRALYFDACRARRVERLKIVSDFARNYVFVKHCQLSNQPSFASTAFVSDYCYLDRLGDWRMGSELCRLTVSEEGEVGISPLHQEKEGIIRDPCVSFDGKKVVFSMRKSELGDDYHLYEMDADSQEIRQITFGPGTADIEPCLLPDGDIIFNSSRCDINVPCWASSVVNLYRCDSEGRYLRRLGFDQAHTVGPSLMNDGRIVFTRWEYNDRESAYSHKLFVMNPDGTAQTEYYGNNSFAPRSIIHPRGIPDSSKIMVIGSGHHTDQSGKLMRMDRREGTQENEGLEFVSPVRFFEPVHDDAFGKEGELFQYPLPIDEDNYLVSYVQEGGPWRGYYQTPFGVYWMNSRGDRELLVYDPTISSGQIAVLEERPAPPIRPDSFDLRKEDGLFYVQNVYYGPGLEGIPKGTVKKLRVVALSYRAMSAGVDYNVPFAQIQTPVSIGNGSWDVKHVLGTVDVEEDGSCFFRVPPRTPVYFQLLDEKGRLVQSMRSWAMVLPGEMFSCVGCHEDKNSTFSEVNPRALAGGKPPQVPVSFYSADERPVPERYSKMSDSERAAFDYLGVNAPVGTDRPLGFSYLREIQPIWDEHCIVCHTGRPDKDGNVVQPGLLGDTDPYGWNDVWRDVASLPVSAEFPYSQNGRDMNPGRDYAESYTHLTNYGRVCYEHKNDNQWLNWHAQATAFPPMRPPYDWGSSKSPLLKYLEPEHYGVQLTEDEKNRVATWIDLCVPYCGSYMEANKWDRITHNYIHLYKNQLRPAYLYYEAKRLKHAEMEVAHLNLYKEHLYQGKDFEFKDFPQYDFGGIEPMKEFVERWNQRDETLPIYGLAEGLDARKGANVANDYRNLAVNPGAAIFEKASFPHASSNSHYKYWDQTAAKNGIDGRWDNGLSWRPNRRTDLWFRVDFGRPVTVDKVVLRLNLNPGQKKTWNRASLVFDNGEKFPVELVCTDEPQEFRFPAKTTAFVTITDLTEEFPLSDNRLAELEVWGKDTIKTR